MESESIAGASIVKIYFHPGATVAGGIAQMSALSQSILSFFPPGMTAPNIVDYNAANVPVAQVNIFSDTLSEQELFDYSQNSIRQRLYSIEGISVPSPFGGRGRAVMVNLNPTKMYAEGLSAADIGNALNNSNIIIPAGSIKIGNREYRVELNGSPLQVANFNRLPLKVIKGVPIFLGEVAPATDTHTVQTNIVRIDGNRATYLPIYKHAAASTLTVIDQVRETLPLILETVPKGMKLHLAFDQSLFVRATLWGVVREAAIAAGLVALMVLIFLGSGRSMLIVILSIPLSILTAVIGLKRSGQSINIMTLGGLALAVGMLVDDATVAIENIHRHHAMHKPLLLAIKEFHMIADGGTATDPGPWSDTFPERRRYSSQRPRNPRPDLIPSIVPRSMRIIIDGQLLLRVQRFDAGFRTSVGGGAA
jgi:multidrug efflux pump subunit AcrB